MYFMYNVKQNDLPIGHNTPFENCPVAKIQNTLKMPKNTTNVSCNMVSGCAVHHVC